MASKTVASIGTTSEEVVEVPFSFPLAYGNENWPSSRSTTDGRPVGLSLHIQALKVIISVGLLAGVILLVGFYYDTSEILGDMRGLSAGSVGIILIALLANALVAAFRFKVLAKEINHPISFGRAMAVVGGGSLAGAIFFQIVGQLIARGVIARRAGIPFAGIVVITAYERFTSAIVSGLLALAGALFIFGNIYFDRGSGGADLIKIMCGLIAAALSGALLGYGRMATASLEPLLTRHFVWRCVVVVGLTLFVQLPMMVAYVIAARALSPHTTISDLVAASAIVMFAASVPISLAGWGVREMSAVVALGAIGVPAHAALTAAILIGVGSLLAMGVIAATTLPGSAGRKLLEESDTRSIDYFRVLSWALPLAVATLVLFQIYVPVQAGLLNVNLADPLAMLSGVLFILMSIRLSRIPRWRVSHINLAAIVATFVLAGSLLIGADRFGWTTWAVTNRFLGWFVLLAYAATGALIVAEGRNEGFRTILLTFAGATGAIAGIEIVLVLLTGIGLHVPVVPNNAEGFSLNHNFFAFQLLMALSAAITVIRGASLRIVVFSLILSGLWFAASRSGWISTALVLAVSLYLRVITIREVAIALIATATAGLLGIGLPHFVYASTGSAAVTDLVPPIVPSAESTHDRLMSIVGGLRLFLAHPIFGAGLGAFRNQMIFVSSPQPLLIHSTAVWLLAELGIVGFLAFAFPAVHIFVKEWRAVRKERASSLIILCFVAFAAMSAPADMLYQRTFWLLTGAGLALRHSSKFARLE